MGEDLVRSMSAMFARALNQATVFCFAEIMGRGWRAVRNRMYEYVAEVMVDLFGDRLRDADPLEVAEAALKLYYPKTELVESRDDRAIFRVRSNCPIVRMSVYMLEKHPEVRRYVCDPDDLVIKGGAGGGRGGGTTVRRDRRPSLMQDLRRHNGEVGGTLEDEG